MIEDHDSDILVMGNNSLLKLNASLDKKWLYRVADSTVYSLYDALISPDKSIYLLGDSSNTLFVAKLDSNGYSTGGIKFDFGFPVTGVSLRKTFNHFFVLSLI